MVFYRKYRPQNISELDSEPLRIKLRSIFSGKSGFPHAFLFTGPKGLGKTSTARIVAKSINCTNKDKKTGEVCNKCDACVSITNGTNMDIVEIDAASNRGIDEIRDLKEKVKLSPLSAVKKVYIIDEVHMLTTEAFNALLKTLEEPPEHVVFVLCTTEPQKVPATILSRCTHIMFLPATKDELVRSFQRIAKGEGLKIDEKVLESIAELSDSGFRDGAKILEELVLISHGEVITADMVEKQYKMTSISHLINKMIDDMAKQDTKSAVEIVEKLSEQGIDVKYFLIRLMEELHRQLLNLIGIETLARNKEIKFNVQELQYLLDLFGKASQEMKQAVVVEIPIELALVEWGSVERGSNDGNEKIKDEIKKVDEESGLTMKSMRKNLGTIAKIKALYGDVPKENSEDEKVVTHGVSLLQYDANSDTKEWMDNLWRNIISEMKSHNHTIAGVLRGCQLKSYDKKSVVIEALYKFHKEKLDESKNMLALEKILKELTGNSVTVSIVLKAK